MSVITLPDLPPEMWEKIYCYCNKSDLLNVACSNKACYAAVRHLLWRVVKVQWKYLEKEETTRQQTKYLQHTRKLYLCGDGFFAKPVAKSFEYVMQHCDPLRLRSLYVIRYPPVKLKGKFRYLECAATSLTNLQEIWLSNIYDVDLSDICKFTELRKLSICDSNIPNDNLEEIDNLTRLEELVISNCSQLSEDVLEHISFVPSLKKLKFAEPHRDIHSDEYVDPIDRLENLDMLNLSHSSIQDSFFSNVSVEVKHRLRDLNIQQCYMVSDVGLAAIAATWCGLVKLNVSHCNRITNKGLSHFAQQTRTKHSPGLQTITLKGCVQITEEGMKPLRDLGLHVVR